MKRVLSLVLAVVLVLGMMPAFAASQTDGEKLQAMGLVDGDENGNLNEGQLLKRGEQVKLILTMMGLEEQAAAYPVAAPFSDMEGHWSAPYVSYAVSIGLVNGYPDGTFRPENYTIGQEFNKLMLGVLNYDTPWTEVPAKAQELGINVEVTETKNVTRGSSFDSMYTSLSVVPNGETQTLGVKLGVMEAPAPTYLKVEDVRALNQIQFEVEFNTSPDGFDKDNLDINNDTQNDDNLAIHDVDFTEGQNVAVVTLQKAVKQQDELDITIKDVEYKKEKMSDYTAQNVTFLDTTLPEVESMSVVGEKTLKVVFSEPMKDQDGSLEISKDADKPNTLEKDNFEVNDGKLYINTVTLQNNNTEALIELYSDLKAGDIKLAVKAGSEDYAGFSVTPETKTLTVVVDTTAPTVVGFEDAKATEVTLIWSEDIEFNGSKTDSDYYHTNESNTAVDPKIDGNKLTLHFEASDKASEDHTLPNGTAYVYVKKDAVQDLWSNKNVQQVVTVNVDVDNTPPSVDSIDVKAEDEINVKFSEEVKKDSATEKDNYTLLDSDGKEVKSPFKSITLIDDDDDDTVKIQFKDKQSGDMSLVVKDVQDAAGNEMTSQTVSFNVTDTTAPDPEDFIATVYNAGGDDQYVIINFKGEMATSGDYSIDDATKYKFMGETGNSDLKKENNYYELNDMIDEVDAKLEIVQNGKAVKISVDKKTDKDGFTFTFDGDEKTDEVVVGRVADAAGNYMVDYSAGLSLVNGNAESAEIAVDKVEATVVDGDYVVAVTFKDELTEIDADDMILAKAADTAAAFAAQTDDADQQDETKIYAISSRNVSLDSDNNTVIKFTLADNDNNKTMTTGTTVYFAVRDKAQSHNEYDQILAATSKGSTDKMKPEIAKYTDGTNKDEYVVEYSITATDPANKAYVTGFTVTVEFTEAIKNGSFTANAFEATVNGDDYTPTGAVVNADTKIVDLTFSIDAADEVEADDVADMSLQVGTTDGGSVYDTNNNPLDPVTVGEVFKK